MFWWKFAKFVSCLKQRISFSSNFEPLFGIIRHNSSILILAKHLYTFSKSSQLKYKFGEILPEQLKVWNFALRWAPCKNNIDSQLKKCRRIIYRENEVMQSLKKTWETDLMFRIWHEEFGEFSPNHSKVQKFLFNGLILSKVYEVRAVKIQRSYLSWHWTVMQNLNNPWPCGFKNGMWNWVNFGWIFFQLENFREIMCHDNEGCWKV